MKNYFFYPVLIISASFIFSCGNGDKKGKLKQFHQWHTITLAFEGSEAAETAVDNPFLNYRLSVDFKNEDTKYTVRGFYAADGNAAETGADSGNVWQVRFTPDKIGNWSYSAQLQQGDSIALSDDPNDGIPIEISDEKGEFRVIPSEKESPDFRAKGRLVNSKGYFRFEHSDEYWLKGGADSPENLLAFEDFDGTYRMQASNDDGEAITNDSIHTYSPHLKDWHEGDSMWQNGKGKGLIGALNYLSSKGMNAVYFLSMNILGDGKDVWPYSDPKDFTRFDVSKLAQWEIVFQHMQSKGLLMHMVLQETENETMLDGGDTGPLRQLYLRELMARFGHHLALKFNIGEENGPASFTPIAQNDSQRKAMTTFLKNIDPYGHPVLLHTHSHEPARSNVLDSIVGFEDLDGLSLQVHKRQDAAEVLQTWKTKSRESGQEWMITMDEIGMWHKGARSDSLDGDHDTLRRYVLWGTLLSGAAGVEWYFGANNRYHDLNTEDWRSRDRLWELTDYALDFFQKNLPYWEMEAEHGLVDKKGAYCFRKKGEVYAIYLPKEAEHSLNLKETEGNFELYWFDPLRGGELQKGSVTSMKGGSEQNLGQPPKTDSNSVNQDWVALVRRNN